MQIQITGPKTLVFQPSHLATVLDALANLPFKVANPVIQEIFSQLQSGEKDEAPKE